MGGARQREMPMGDGKRRSWARASSLGNCYLALGKGEDRSPAAGYAVRDQPGGNRVAGASVRYAVAVRPEHGETAVALLVFSSRAAAMMGQPEPLSVPAASWGTGEGRQPLHQLETWGEGIRDALLFLCATSLAMMMFGDGWDAVLFLCATSWTTMMRPGLGYRAVG